MDQSLVEAKLDIVFKNMEDSVCITDRLGVLQYANNAAKKLFNIRKQNIGADKIWKMIPYVETNDDLVQMFIDATAAREKTIQQIVDYEKDDGTVSRLRVNITFTNEEDEQFFVIVVTNLTELFRVNAAFKRYTSEEIAEYVLNTPEGEKQGGESKQVSILMSDLRGFTALSTRLTPKELIELLNHYFSLMVEVIVKYHGTVVEFLGDGIFVVFGAPMEDKLHAQHAVMCAVEMENTMEAVNAWNKENGFPKLWMGIGINSGQAVVGNIGSDDKMKYGCMGETVNLAGRVESFTIGGQILISENTKKQIDAQLSIGEEQKVMPKGAKKEISIYSIEGVDDLHLDFAGKDIKWSTDFKESGVSFRMLLGKTVGEEEYTAMLTKLSDDDRYGFLQSDAAMEKLQNIMLEIGGDLYAKVTEVQKDGYVICFTAKPESFKSWKEHK